MAHPTGALTGGVLAVLILALTACRNTLLFRYT